MILDKKLEKLKSDYQNIPIPDNLDFIVANAISRSNVRKFPFKSVIGLAASAIFILSINSSPTFAKTLSDVPIVGTLVDVLTFTEYTVDEKTYQAHLKVPAVSNLKNKDLENSLNQKYLNENKQLYDTFTKEMDEMKKENGGHLGIDSGYEVKTDTDNILSIGRYVVNTVGSSSTTMTYDTIDKKKEILLTLPLLFKDETYINLISENIKEQMKEQMKHDENKLYWFRDEGDETTIGLFDKISSKQNFYINKDNQLVISFDKYEVAPGAMGIIEFIIPSDILSDALVSNHYIK